VFSDRHTIYDNYFVNLKFKKGTLGSYRLLNFGPPEYCGFSVTGTLGELRFGTAKLPGEKEYVTIAYNDGRVENVDFEHEGGMHGHGGADVRMVAAMLGFEGKYVSQDHLATAEDARQAIIAAELANLSLANNGTIATLADVGKRFPPQPPQPSSI
jgi:hypothetical protein